MYAHYLELEKLLETSQAAFSFVQSKYPDLIRKWEVLRSRMGRYCPMARSTLKVICAYEKSNQKFIESCKTGVWIESI